MTFATIRSPSSQYLAATDLLIGDMSDINYEFLILNRPIILLANRWIRDNWPPIGHKTNMEDLNEHIDLNIDKPFLFEKSRKEWLEKTFDMPFIGTSKRILKIALNYSGITTPELFFIHGGSEVRKTNLYPLYDEASQSRIRSNFVAFAPLQKKNNHIYFSAHYEDLPQKYIGFKIHLDHAPKGKGAANLKLSTDDYEKNDYFPWIDLHITAGKTGYSRTKLQLGPNFNRVVSGGYPKAENILKYNNESNKKSVFNEFGFNLQLPLITYAPAGYLSNAKPGGSLSEDILKKLFQISLKNQYNILIKYKANNLPIFKRAYIKIARKFYTKI
ncbi:MAG: hypothetical protein HQ541_14710 [Mariniphaga sp.]|nr:hypothetical protein [Mariniphaga sp.]